MTNIEQMKKDCEAHCKEYGYAGRLESYHRNYCLLVAFGNKYEKLSSEFNLWFKEDSFDISIENKGIDHISLDLDEPKETYKLFTDFYEKLMKCESDYI